MPKTPLYNLDFCIELIVNIIENCLRSSAYLLCWLVSWLEMAGRFPKICCRMLLSKLPGPKSSTSKENRFGVSLSSFYVLRYCLEFLYKFNFSVFVNFWIGSKNRTLYFFFLFKKKNQMKLLLIIISTLYREISFCE